MPIVYCRKDGQIEKDTGKIKDRQSTHAQETSIAVTKKCN